MKINRLLLLLGFAISFSTAKAQMTTEELNEAIQESNEQKLVVHCSRMLQENFFYYADVVTNRLLEINPESANYNYRKGFILLEMHTEFERAINYLTKATGNTIKNYDMYSAGEKAAPIDVFYHLGRAYHLNEEYDKAIEQYSLFIEKTAKQSELIAEAALRIKQCNVAKTLVASPGNIKVKNLGDKVNTRYGDYSSQISLDGKSLHLTSRRKWENGESESFRDPMFNNYTEDIYVMKLDDAQQWSNPKKLDLSKPQLNEASVSISLDERKIYLYKDSSGLGDIFITEYSSNEFNSEKPLTVKGVNSGAWEPHLMVSPDGKIMYFVSDRSGGKGKRDIYYMEKKGGAWSAPINFSAINTENDEDSPFVGLDNNVLYYSSNHENSMGGFDVFMVVRDAQGNWSPPVNLGYPINSPGDDIFFTTTADGKQSYVSSLRKGGLGEKDVYEVMFPQATTKNVAFLNGKIIHANGKKIPESSFITLACKNCDDSNEETILPRIEDGGFFSKLEKCKEYVLTYYYKENSPSPYRETFKTDCDLAYQEVNKTVLLIEEKERITRMFDYDLDGKVTSNNLADNSTKSLENATVEIYNRKGNKVETLKTDESGEFISKLTTGLKFKDKLDYYAVVSAENHTTDTFDIQLTLKTDSILHLAFEISTNKNIGELLALNPIYFDFDKSNIRPDAAIELDKVVEFLKKYPEVKIELGSHTDSRGPASYNQSLSEKRAISSAKYLKKRVENPKRISYKGYGESKTTNGCNGTVSCTEEQHQMNRRTEFIIQK
jgi:outer membrane protein OmpA-like peptidoglycan-associated protein/Tol biopolymer transport system component